ncbi:MAG: acyl carrier protein [Dokdonella sp.]|uniref:acyl carrier protein n=1 Tax=Dokdonella sp. TaxID=2291710 RepID=UPI002B866DDA|nr:acyl carrier protein [Dokdonella sp.]HOX72147.1 acyl carrier protein [Dokdonella sp.]HPG93340.1 acyl carrier protein [Dokdonella sp.]HPN78004.1 acyl carrier protein [Dokdonella sp.]
MPTIEQRIRDYLNENLPFAPSEALDPDESLFDAGVLDSIGVMGLVSWLEREFDIIVDDNDVVPENIDGIRVLVSFVEGKLSEAGLGG